MAVKLPRLCVSHTIYRDDVKIRVLSNTPTNDATTAAFTVGRYWIDPVYGTAATGGANGPCLLACVAAMVDASAAVVGTVGKSYSTTSSPAYRATFNCASGDFAFSPQNGNTTAEGRDILRRIGANLVTVSDTVNSGNARTMPYAISVWDPDRAESGDIDESWDGFGSHLRMVDGTVYTNDMGNPLPRRMVGFRGLSGSYARDRPSDGATRYGFEHIVWPWLARGEAVRYYADRTATTTYLTAAMTAATATAAVADRTGISVNDLVCVGGEWMKVTATGSGAGNLTVTRHAPVAHSNYEPLAKDFVATYVLDEQNGDVSRRTFAPSRRAVNQDRWDFDIGLVRVLA